MRKTISTVKNTGFILLISVSFLMLGSCKKKEECNLPVIEYIYDYSTGEKVDGIAPSKAYGVHGYNFDGVARFLINNIAIDDWALGDTNINFNTPSFIVTADSSQEGIDVIEIGKICGSSKYKTTILLPRPIITRISNEYAIAGNQIFIEGVNFVDMERFAFREQKVDGLLTSHQDSTSYMTVPNISNTPDELVLITSENDSSISATGVRFHPVTGLLCNFDGINNYGTTSGQIIPSSSIANIEPANDTIFVARATNVVPNTSDVPSMNLPLEIVIDFDIDGSRPANLVALKFEMFSSTSWEKGYYTFEIGYRNTSDVTEFAYRYNFNPEEDSDYSNIYVENWLTYTLPFSRFELVGNPGTYMQSFSQMHIANYITCSFSNAPGGPTISEITIGMDNFRITEISNY